MIWIVWQYCTGQTKCHWVLTTQWIYSYYVHLLTRPAFWPPCHVLCMSASLTAATQSCQRDFADCSGINKYTNTCQSQHFLHGGPHQKAPKPPEPFFVDSDTHTDAERQYQLSLSRLLKMGAYASSPELDTDWIHPWIGLDWIGSICRRNCIDWTGLGQMTANCLKVKFSETQSWTGQTNSVF